MSVVAQSETLAGKLISSPIPQMARDLPELDVNSDEFMPIKFAKEINVVELLDANPVWSDRKGFGCRCGWRRWRARTSCRCGYA